MSGMRTRTLKAKADAIAHLRKRLTDEHDGGKIQATCWRRKPAGGSRPAEGVPAALSPLLRPGLTARRALWCIGVS